MLLYNLAVIIIISYCSLSTQGIIWMKELDNQEAIFDRDSIEDSNVTLALCRNSDINFEEKVCLVNQNILRSDKFPSVISGPECEITLQPDQEFSIIKMIKVVSFGSGRVLLAWIDEDRWGNKHRLQPKYLLKFRIIYTEDCRVAEGEIFFDYTGNRKSKFLKGSTIVTYKDGTFDIFVPNYSTVNKLTFNSNGKLIAEDALNWLSVINFDCLNFYPIANHSPEKGYIILACDSLQSVLLYRADKSVRGLHVSEIQYQSTENDLAGFCNRYLECWQYRPSGYLPNSFKMQLNRPSTDLVTIYNLPDSGFLAISASEGRDYFVSVIDGIGHSLYSTSIKPFSCERSRLVSRTYRKQGPRDARDLTKHCIVLACKSNELYFSFECYDMFRANGSLRYSSN